MAERFEIQIAQVKRIAEQYANTSRTMENCSISIQNISGCLHGSSYERIRQVLKRLAEENRVNAEKVRALEAAISSCMELYEGTEKRILDGETAKTVSVETSGGESNGNAGEEDIWDFLYDTLMQVIGGDFYDDGNWLGILLSVLVGCIPFVGQLCDLRDVLANIGKLIDDGPQASEWIALIFSGVAFVPLIGDFLKHADEGAEAAGGIVKHMDDLKSPLKEYTKEFHDFMDKNVFSKLDDFIGREPTAENIRHAVEEFLNKDTGFFHMTPKKYLEDLIKALSKDVLTNWAREHIDNPETLNNEEIRSAVRIGDFVWAA